MDFDEYQWRAKQTAIYPGQGNLTGLMYAALGLAGEAGEVANKVQKAWRDDGTLTTERQVQIMAEVGGVLWYAAQVCTEMLASFGDVAEANLAILASRQARGVLSGSGDER